MKPNRSFRPVLQQVEGRIVPSFSLSNFVHSVFPEFSNLHAAKHDAHPARTAHHQTSHQLHATGHPHGIHDMRHPARA